MKRLLRVAGSLGALTLASLTQGSVFINELFYHPPTELDRDEWLELVNTGTNRVDLSGWRFTEGVRFTFPAGAKIEAGGFLVVAANATAFATLHPAVTHFVAGWDGILSNSGQQVLLVDAAGNTVDSVRYADDGDWADRLRDVVDYGHRGWVWESKADGFGASLELRQVALPNEYGRNWAASTVPGGTPGAANSTTTTNLAPLITETRHQPLVPRASDPVVIVTRLLDEAATATLTASLRWRVDGAANFSSLPLFDDGLHGDGGPHDGVFAATIPPQVNGSIVEYYVAVADAAGNSRNWPAPALVDGVPQQVANALFQVDDAAPLTPLKPGELPGYRLILTAAERAELESINRNTPAAPFPQPAPFNDQTRSHAQFNATFISLDGTGPQLRYLIGVRNRGNGSRTKSPPGLRLHLRNDDLWNKVSALNLNSQYTPAQLFGSALYQRAGLAAANSRPIHLRVNNRDLQSAGSPNYGFYVANEVVNSEFAARAFPDDSSGDLYRGIRLTGNGADLSFNGTDATPYRENYFKQSNTSQDDWRDLIELCRVLDTTPDATYQSEVERVVNVETWMRYFALETLVDNKETNLGNGNNGTGDGDDYFLYVGRDDLRSRVVPYDLDTILGLGDTGFNLTDGIFRMAANPIVSRLVKHPAFVPTYYRLLVELANRDFSSAHFNPLVDEILADHVTDSVRQTMKDFAAARRDAVLAQIPLTLSATNTSLTQVNGAYQTLATTVALHGHANAVTTRSVHINGQPATWSAWDAAWTNSAITLHAGLNRLLVQSLDHTGKETERLIVTVISTANAGTTTGGNIAANATWTPASSPYRVTSSLTVASGATLTIQPGTSIYLSSGVNFTVANGGRLLAEGTEMEPIVFTRDPATFTSWGGVVVNGAAGSPETRIAYAHFVGNGTTCIHVTGATVFLDHLTFGTTDKQYLSLDDSSFVVRYCHFPVPTAGFEPTHGTGGIKSGGHGIFYRNFFGAPTGYNDVLDFSGGNRPGEPILHFIENVIAGSGDDGLDLDGTDAWIEGNIFTHIHRNGAPDSSAAISGGSGGGDTSEITILNNLFFDCDNAVTAKQGNFYTLFHNTIVHTTKKGGQDFASGIVNLRDTTPDVTTPGRGAYLEGNVITDAEQLIRNPTDASPTTFVNNVLPFAWTGSGNQVANARLKHIPSVAEVRFTDWQSAQVLREWFSLQPDSPAIGAGFGGRNLGALQPPGVMLSGVPTGTNAATSLTVSVGPLRTGNGIPTDGFPLGSGYVAYRWRLAGSAWSAETPINTPIQFTGLSEGVNRLEVSGKLDSGLYQDDPLFGDMAHVTTALWVVDPTYVAPTAAAVELSEVLAAPAAGASDRIELYNLSEQPVNLTGWSLTDAATSPRKFVFPAGTVIGPSQFLAVTADDPSGPGLFTGFGLKGNGDSVTLFDARTNLVDSVVFGLQIPGRSLGHNFLGNWVLCEPTFGTANQPLDLGEGTGLHLNEWLAAATSEFSSDFVELFNADPLPAALGGLYLTDNLVGAPLQYRIPDLSFIDGRGYVAFLADGSAGGGNHLPFKLSSEQGTIALFAADGSLIDSIAYGPQYADVSQGRSPNGSSLLRFLPTPTPGGGNPGGGPGETNITTLTFDLVSYTNSWRYYQAGAPAAGWNTAAFNDAAWPQGNALFHVGGESFTMPQNTALTLGKSAYYFRTHFTPATNDPLATLQLQALIDDGALVWLNGHPLYRQNLNQANPAYADYAASTVSTASFNGPNEVPTTWLVPGDNVLAVEVHQANAGSSDVTFALKLFQSLSTTNVTGGAEPIVLNEVLARNYGLAESDGTHPDWVELYNPNANAVNLAGLALTDDLAQPGRFVFPANSLIGGKSFLRVRLLPADSGETPNTTDPVAAFGLDGDGDHVYLLDTVPNSRALLDSVAFGFQLHDRSVGRVPDGSGTWKLTEPTPGSANFAVELGDANAVTVNEWMPNPNTGEDWFELHNPGSKPVDLSGWHVTDDLTTPAKHTLPALSFLGTGAEGFVKLIADGTTGGTANHVSFKLDNKGESVGWATPAGVLLDWISYTAASKGVSEGRFPDDSATIVKFPTLPTPGASNRADADLDGVADDWELAHKLSPNNSADAMADTDGDGASNRDEFLAGTDPRNATSALRATIPAIDATGLTIRFTAVAGVAYRLQSNDSLDLPNWTTLTSVAARPGERVLAITVPTGESPRFYRVVVD